MFGRQLGIGGAESFVDLGESPYFAVDEFEGSLEGIDFGVAVGEEGLRLVYRGVLGALSFL
jgi:hypothetical protein